MPNDSRPRSVRISALVLAATLAATFSAGPASAAPAGTSLDRGGYVALGDSFSSGNGSGTYDKAAGSCNQSDHAYPQLTAKSYPGVPFTFAACSDATTGSVVASQLSRVSAATTTITITIGGNDIDFASTVASCVRSDAACMQAVATALARIADTLPARLDAAYSAIAARAPKARLVVLGYPRLFGTGTCPSFTEIHYNASRRALIDLGADRLDAMIAQRAAAAGAQFIDPRNAFADHGVCSAVPWINAPLTGSIEGWFHPNAAGQQAYAALLAAGSRTITVRAVASGVATGVTVAAGELVRITATGTATYGHEGQAGCAGIPTVGPDGVRSTAGKACTPKLDADAKVASAPIGALIARIGSGSWFLVGSGDAGAAPANGRLELAFNDSLYADNSGTYHVTITHTS